MFKREDTKARRTRSRFHRALDKVQEVMEALPEGFDGKEFLRLIELYETRSMDFLKSDLNGDESSESRLARYWVYLERSEEERKGEIFKKWQADAITISTIVLALCAAAMLLIEGIKALKGIG